MKLEAKNINMSYEKGKKVLDQVCFSLQGGNITGLIGRNGSGKTTILNILAQILNAQSGDIRLDGKDLLKHPELKTRLAYLPDRFDYFPYKSGEEAMEYYSLIYPDFDKDWVREEAERMGVDLQTNIRNLSKGNNGLLGLLIVLATGADFILLDEVVDGIDVLNKRKVIEYVLDAREDGKGIFISSHQISELQGICDHVYYLDLKGRLSKGDDGLEHTVFKYQIVSKETLPKEVLEKIVVVQHIGRVYTALISGAETIEELLSHEDILQYDELPIQLEDLFYWEEGQDEKY